MGRNTTTPGPTKGGGFETRLAVIGSPIQHSRSPLLHRTAYDMLGLPWRYDAIDVRSGALGVFLHQLGPQWRGLSLTMPHKHDIRPFLRTMDPVAEKTGTTNTVLIRDGELHGFNTDVEGIRRTLAEAHPGPIKVAHILGGGATAASAIVALASLGTEYVVVRTRNVATAAALTAVAHAAQIQLAIMSLATPIHKTPLKRTRVHGTPVDKTSANNSSHSAYNVPPDAVVSTLPGGITFDDGYDDEQRNHSTLLDVAYAPWPSPLCVRWRAVGGTAVSGLPMLVDQALIQIRIFVNGDPQVVLPDEDTIRTRLLRVVDAQP